jgi:putative membrane protein
MLRFLFHMVAIAAALWVATLVVPGVEVSSWGVLAVAALVLGLVNALVRPLLTLLTLPITILTLGLFYLVVNGLCFALAAFLVPGFHIGGFLSAIFGALVVSVVSWFVGLFGPRKKK